jgi:hypothetical protein
VGSDLGPVDADESVVGLMARDALHLHFETFFWGQEYGGSQESLLVALLLLVRIPIRIAMELVPAGLAAGTAYLVWRIGLRVTTPAAAATAGLAAWIATPTMLWFSTKERGFYGATSVLGLAAILLALRYKENPTPRLALAVGLSGGLAWWASPQSVYLLLPAALLALTPHLRGLRASEGAAAVVGFVGGAAPWLYTNAHTRLGSFQLSEYLPDTTFRARFGAFFGEALPIALGLRRPLESTWNFGRVGHGAYLLGLAVLVAALVAVLVRTRHRWLAVAVALYPFVFALFPTSFYVKDGRYLLFLLPLASLLMGLTAGLFRRDWVLCLCLGTLCLGSALGTLSLVRLADRAERFWDFAAGSVGPLVAELEAEGVERAFADYWVSYRLPYATEGRIKASAVTEVRSPVLERSVRSAALPSYVLIESGCSDQQVQAALGSLGIGFKRSVVGDYALIKPHDRVMPEELVRQWAEQRDMSPARAATTHSC